MCPTDWLAIVKEISGAIVILGIFFAIAWAVRG